MKTKKQLRKNVVRTIKSILATVLLLTCIEYFPTIASAEGEDAGTANETISEYGSTELAEAAEQSQEGSTIIVNQPQQEEQASEPAQEQQEEVLADIQQQNTVENDECDKQELKENIKQENGKGENPDNSQEEIEETQEQDNKPASDTYPYYVYNQYYDVAGNQVGSNVIVLKKLDNTEATVDITFDTIISHLSKQYKARLLEGESEVEGKVTRNVTLTANDENYIYVQYIEVVEEAEEPVTETAEEEIEKEAAYKVTTNVEYTEDNASAIITIKLNTEDEALFLDINLETIDENLVLYDADDNFTYFAFETVVNGTYNFDVQVVDSETLVETNGVQESKRYDEPQTAVVDQIDEENSEEYVGTNLNENPETYALPNSRERIAYFYIWKPGTAEGTDYRTAWYYAGTGKVNMPRPTASGIKYYDMNNVVSYPKSMPNIVSDDKTYYYDENGTDTVHQYTYRMNWAYIRDVYGANDGDKEITKENVYHVDGYAILSDKLTIDFEVYYPDDDGFSSITGWPKLFAENAKVVAPTVSNTTVYNGITYEFDGWYTDGSLTTKATENDFIATSNKVFYGKYKQILNVHYYQNSKNEYNDYIQTVYYNEYTTTVDGSALSHDNDKTFVGWVLDYTEAGIKSAEGVIASKKAYEKLLNSNLLIAPNANYGPITKETKLYAVWAKESITTPLKIKYEWNLPIGITYYNDLGSTLDPQPVVPTDNNTYYSGYSYMVNSTYTYGDKVYTVDSYGNINGVYTFSGWTDPNNGIMGDANVTIKGTWTYTPMDVTKYTVTYTYEGDTPTNAPALPKDDHKYVNNEPFTASAAKVADIPTYDTYRNQNGVWKFNGWTPASGKIEGANVTIKGSWTYTPMDVTKYTVTYTYESDTPTNAPAVPEDDHKYVNNEPFTASAAKVADIPTYDTYRNQNGVWKFNGWTPASGKIEGANVTIKGTWTYTPMDVTKYTVTYTYEGDTPTNAPALPKDEHKYVNNEPFTASTAKVADIPTYDTYRNQNGVWKFNGWTPASGKIEGANVTIKGTWTYTPMDVTKYTVTYTYEGDTPTNAPAVPEDDHKYVNNEPFTASTAKVADIPTYDTYRNQNGVWKFNGWTPASGKIEGANVTIKGSWTYTPMDVTKYTVTYTYEGDTPTNAPALPKDDHKYVNNEPFTASTAKVADIPTYDTYRNQNGVWKFNGWTPASGKIEGANVTIKGSWTYTPMDVTKYTVTYTYEGDTPTNAPALPKDDHKYVNNEPFTASTAKVADIPTYDTYRNQNGVWKFNGWTPASGKIEGANVTIKGTWTYTPMDVTKYTVTYTYEGDTPTNAPALPKDEHKYVNNEPFTASAAKVADIPTYDTYRNQNGVWKFNGWTPASGKIEGANVTIKGTWTYTPMDVTKYTVTYTYEGDTPTNAPALPKDEHKYVNNEPFTASAAKVADIPTYDTYRNQNGVWKFNGWTPASGKIEGANVTIKGSWIYETVQVATHSITIKFVDDYGNALKDQLSYTLINNQDYDYSSLAEGKLIKDGKKYVLDHKEGAALAGTVTGDVEVTLVYSLDIKGNEEDGGSDSIPDKYQIMFTYESAGNGTVDGKEKVFETHTFRDENEELIPAGKAKPTNIPELSAKESYAFDYWAHGEEKDFNSNMSKFVVDYEADQTFTVYFDIDEVGKVDPEGEDKPDGTPDKYQVRVDYVAVNGTVDFDHVYVTLYEDGVYSKTGTGSLTEDQIPGAKANAGFENGKWDVEPTTEIVIKENTVFTITFTAIPAPEVVPPNPGRTCQDDGYPEGYTWDEGQQACVCTADVCRVPEHPQPGNGGEQLPEETDEPVVVEEEVTPTTPAPEVEEIIEEETPLVAGRSWALVNLIACITGAVLAIVLLIMKKSKSEELEDEYDENGMKIEKTDEEKEDEAIPYIRKTMWKVVTAIVAIVAVIVFFLTEDMRLPMVMVDKWTLLMIIFALVNVLSLVLGMKWHEDEKVVNIVGNSATVAYNGSIQEVQGYTTDINTKKIEVTLKKDAKDEVSGVNVGRYNMGLTADCFEVKSDVYSNIKLVVTDGYLDIKAKD